MTIRVIAAFIVVGLATVAGITSFQGPIQRRSIAADHAKNSGPISPRAAAYLDALKRENVPVEDIPTLLLVADSVCARQGENKLAQASRLTAAFPDRWSSQQAAVIVNSAMSFVCRDTASRGVEVSAAADPAK